MTRLLLITLGLLLSSSSFARPGGLYLVSPTKIECKGTALEVTFDLPCSNDHADEWGGEVLTYDDSGDREVAVGIVAAMSSCQKSKFKRSFKRKISLKKTYGRCDNDEQTFHAVTLAQ